MLKAIWTCISGVDDTETLQPGVGYATKAQPYPFAGPAWDDDNTEHDARLAHSILAAMQSSEKTGEELRANVADVVASTSWTESLAKAVLNAVDDAIKKGTAMQKEGPLKAAVGKAIQAAANFAKDHPVWTTLIAIGVLVELLPWVIEALGFGIRGPVAGMPF
jgi:enamine deaminase RidA (YjgF/YER057c/UK114 family)